MPAASTTAQASPAGEEDAAPKAADFVFLFVVLAGVVGLVALVQVTGKKKGAATGTDEEGGMPYSLQTGNAPLLAAGEK